jgi:hypothetical protein
LREAQVVGVRRPPAANQTSLLGDRFDVIAVAHPTRFGQPKYGFVDPLSGWRLAADRVRARREGAL